MRKIYEAFAGNIVFANIAIGLMFLAGFVAVNTMTREMFPEFSLDRVAVQVPYPGADPEEVEEGIIRKIEDAIEGEEGIKEITSTASENFGTVIVTVREDAELRDVQDRIRSKVDGVSTFPVDAENPIVSELTLKEPVVILSIAGDMPDQRMKEWAERTKEQLLQQENITAVDIYGIREYEISIEVAEEKLRQLQLSLADVEQSIRSSNLNMPAGTIRSDTEEVRLRAIGRKYTAEEFAEIIVATRPSGEMIKLGDIATIVDGFEENIIRAEADGNPAVFIYVQKTKEQDALDISAAALKFVDEQQGLLPENMTLAVVYDTTDMLRARINLLTKNGTIGLLIVFGLLWIFLDARLSFWAGMGMPISIAGALVLLWAIGGTINMISLFGLIMVLGIIVDDAIVVGESIYHHHQSGDSPLKAAVNGVAEVGVPVFGAVTTSIIAFLPLMHIGGIMGKFISILPKVVIACLIVSLFECLLLLPAHLGGKSHKKRKPARRHHALKRFHAATGEMLERFIEGPYARFLTKALSFRYVSLSIAIGVLMITFGMIGGGLIKFRMFPKFDSFILTAIVEFPEGTPITTTERALDQIEEAGARLNARIETRSGDPAIKRLLKLSGQSLGENPTDGGHHMGSVQLILVDSEDRNIEAEGIQQMWEEEIGLIAGADALTIEGLSAGPPGKPIDIGIRGNDLESMKAAASELMDILGTYAGVSQIQRDFRPGKNEFLFTLKPEARTLGLTVEDLGRQLNRAYYGGEALRIQRGRDNIRVMVRYTKEERSRVADLSNVRIRTRDGSEIPLLSVADVEIAPGVTSIKRLDGLRTISVSADLDKKIANAQEINADLEQKVFQKLSQDYPGVYLRFQGEKKDSEESIASLKIGFPLALIGIYVVIATIFRSYIQPLIIMITVPFGIIGAVVGHMLMGFDLSLMSMFGIVALAGVVVNDAIVLIEAINHNLANGMSLTDAIVTGGKRRFRAVFLTTLSTVGGLTPLIIETDLQAQFLIPMALSIAAGVAFGTVLTLLLIPNLIAILNDFRVIAHIAITGTRPANREQLEPAATRFAEKF